MSPVLTVARETWPVRGVFRISRGARTEAEVVVVSVTDGAVMGRGECVPYARYGETVDSVIAQIEGVTGAVAGGLDRVGLLDVLPAGAARNAVDCALWDLEAKTSGTPVWTLAGLTAAPEPVTTAYTLGVDSPEAMGAAAADKAALQPGGALPCMEKATAEQGDEVEQREGGVVLEVAEAAAHLRRELSPLICGTHVLKSGAHRRPWSDSELGANGRCGGCGASWRCPVDRLWVGCGATLTDIRC